VRTGRARAIHQPSTASSKPWSAGPVGIRSADDGCGTHTTPESRCCRCGCRDDCCCGCPRARCPDCCSQFGKGGAAAQHARLGLGTPHRFPGGRRLPPWPGHVEPSVLPIAQPAQVAVADFENSRNRASRGTANSGSASSDQSDRAQRMGDDNNTRNPTSPSRPSGWSPSRQAARAPS